MKEKLLKAILHILAIVAKEKHEIEEERKNAKIFLLGNVSATDVPRYLHFFDDKFKKHTSQSDDEDRHIIERLCKELNQELTQTQKIVALMYLMELIVADSMITAYESNLFTFIGQQLKIISDAVQLIKSFVITNTQEKLDKAYILLINGSKEANYRSATHLYCPQLQGFIAILNLDVYGLFFIKYVGDDVIYVNGNALKSHLSINFAAGSVIKTAAHTMYYSDVIQKLLHKKVDKKIVLTAKNVSFTFKDGVQALHNISIQEHGGRLAAIMGGSGTGKSTLINILNGSNKPTSGHVYINGVDIHAKSKKIAGLIGYVPQDNLLFNELTIYENLYYAAKFCFRNLSEKKLKVLVYRTLQDLDIYNIRHVKVGSPLEGLISGGQRKRLNIGLELIRKPPMLFVDEPTSGLSSRDSEKVMELLKDLSLKGNLIVCIIHQPSSNIYKMFDSLTILDAQGYQIYYGNPVKAVTYFKEIIDRVDKSHAQCMKCGNINTEQIFDIIETRVIDEYGKETQKRKIVPQMWHKYYVERLQNKAITLDKSLLPLSKALNIANRVEQFFIFTARDFISKISNKQYLAINFLSPLILASVLAYIARASLTETYTFSDNPNIGPFFFMSIIIALFMGLTVSAEEIFKDTKILKRESFLHLSKGSYLWSKLFILFTLSAIQMLIFTVVSSLIIEIKAFMLPYWLVLFSTACFANILGLNISASFNSIATIYIVVPILLIPQIILSGVVIRFDEINPHLSDKRQVPWVGEMMASKWAFEALTVTQFKDNPYTKQTYIFDKKIAIGEYYATHWSTTMQNYLDEARELRALGQTKALKAKLRVIRNEIRKQLKHYGEDQFPIGWENIMTEHFNENMYASCTNFVKIIQKIYSNIYKEGIKGKAALMSSIREQVGKPQDLIAFKNSHENDRLGKVVKGLNFSSIEKVNDELVQIVYPIYATPEPQHVFAFRTRLFYPEKYFAGTFFPTLYFNVAVIWIMTLLLFWMLYLDVFKKILNLFALDMQRVFKSMARVKKC